MEKKKMYINPDISSLELEAFRNLRKETKVNNQQQEIKFKKSYFMKNNKIIKQNIEKKQSAFFNLAPRISEVS